MSIIKPDTARFVFDLPAQDCSMDQFDEWAHRERYYLQVQHSLGFEEPKSVSPGKLFYDFLEEANALEEQIDEMREWCFWYRTSVVAMCCLPRTIGPMSSGVTSAGESWRHVNILPEESLSVYGRPSINCCREEFDEWAKQQRWFHQELDMSYFSLTGWGAIAPDGWNDLLFRFKSHMESSVDTEVEIDKARAEIFGPRTNVGVVPPTEPSKGEVEIYDTAKEYRRLAVIDRLQGCFNDKNPPHTEGIPEYTEVNAERASRGLPPFPLQETESDREKRWDRRADNELFNLHLWNCFP